MALVECVPNVSESRRTIVYELCAAVRDAVLLDCTSDVDHNRSVLTFAGEPEQVLLAAINLAEAVFARADLREHEGVHPRIGVLDVLPFVPVMGVTLEYCAELARKAAEELWRRFRVPSFLYEAAGSRTLERVRLAEREGAAPDVGMGRNLAAGAVAVGARNFLVAWNIWLATEDVEIARQIARAVRASSGGFRGVKALGLGLKSRGMVQVSINSVDFEATPLHVVFEAVERMAREAGVGVVGSELIGLIPERAVALSRGHDLKWMHWDEGMIFER
ncbi:MAG: glutamate formimidoyltransferase, partial [Acidobacteriota bacterium]|nr:glutamate formimidoyltransferase [Acidobacteriota bacterium]